MLWVRVKLATKAMRKMDGRFLTMRKCFYQFCYDSDWKLSQRNEYRMWIFLPVDQRGERFNEYSTTH